MSHPSDLSERLARHLSGTASEAEREQLEREALEDDPLFDQLEALESELVDAYVRGELDAEAGRGVARLLDVSERIRSVADTTLALEIRTDESTGASTAATTEERPSGDGRRWPAWAGTPIWPTLLILVLIAFGLWLGHLSQTARDLERENAALRSETKALEETLARLEETNRALALRLARIEARSQP